jgi:uncharacterized membrane protein
MSLLGAGEVGSKCVAACVVCPCPLLESSPLSLRCRQILHKIAVREVNYSINTVIRMIVKYIVVRDLVIMRHSVVVFLCLCSLWCSRVDWSYMVDWS